MLTPHTLVCEYLADPIGLDVRQPRLSWQLNAQHRDARQTAYHICVGKSAAALEGSADGIVWDTGKVLSDRSMHIPYAGPALQPGQRCYWQVRVWDESDTVSGWSNSAFWEMGLLNSSNWRAEWISA